MIEAPPGSPGEQNSAQNGLDGDRVHGHTSGLATAPTEWETRVIGFLDQAIDN